MGRLTSTRLWVRLIVPAVVVATIATVTLDAWGLQGHRLVAMVAERQLTPAAKQQVAWLLDGRSLADVSIWADEYLSGNYQTSFWHYVNIPPDAAAYDRDRDCPRQPGIAAGTRNDRWRDCIVDRIPYHLERLGNAALDRADRAIALKFLVHFVGDLHQPLHAIGVERGGNGILVTVFGSPTCGGNPSAPTPCNLHGVWDSSLIAHRQLSDADYLAVLNRVIVSERLTGRPTGTPPEWAMESLALAKAALLPQQGIVDEAYYRAQISVIDERLALGGLRLAAMINGIQ
jgi:nuclease S1